MFRKFIIAMVACHAASLFSGCSGSGNSLETANNGLVATPSATPPPAAGNQPPTISGDPTLTVLVGDSWTFTPSASDADGDELTFSIVNRPSWASFSATTGTLEGTPALGDEAVYDNIVISVNDGEFVISLPAFAITVTQAATGTVTLTWTAPTLNTDGSPLTDLDAYKIYYGTSQGIYPNEIRIDNPGITTYVVDNLSPNTYYFVCTSINSNDIESEFSNIAMTTVNPDDN